MHNAATTNEAPSPNTTSARQAVARRRCQICQHPERWRIELLKAGGASLDSIAAKFNTSRDAVDNHWRRHVSAEMKASYLIGPVQLAELGAKAAEHGGSVLDHLHVVRTVLLGHLSNVTEAGDARSAAIVAGKLTELLQVIARISGELGDLARNTTYSITNNVVISEHPAFLRVQASLLQALAPFPDARGAVVAALRGLDAEHAPARTVAAANGRLIEAEASHVPA